MAASHEVIVDRTGEGEVVMKNTSRLMSGILGALICLTPSNGRAFDNGMLRGIQMAQASSCESMDVSWTPQWSSLLAYWPLNGLVGAVNSTSVYGDYSGKGRSLTAGSALVGESGKYEQAVAFNGSAKYLQSPTTSSLQPTNAVTLSAWLKFNSLIFRTRI
ncbi:MAG: hypothetical protein EOP06_01770 [Proteobacteria bacterium]|nr:MAG: hypothetical protein EOP06_01770 [Pseudomonadota bacterium]